jgi:hypothetical protein
MQAAMLDVDQRVGRTRSDRPRLDGVLQTGAVTCDEYVAADVS